MSISTDQRDKAMKFKLPKLDINVNKTDKKESIFLIIFRSIQ